MRGSRRTQARLVRGTLHRRAEAAACVAYFPKSRVCSQKRWSARDQCRPLLLVPLLGFACTVGNLSCVASLLACPRFRVFGRLVWLLPTMKHPFTITPGLVRSIGVAISFDGSDGTKRFTRAGDHSRGLKSSGC